MRMIRKAKTARTESAASRSLSEAGRAVFDVSGMKKETANDADRLRKYLTKFNLDWRTLAGQR
jgi:transcriptional regulatory protein RtcR